MAMRLRSIVTLATMLLLALRTRAQVQPARTLPLRQSVAAVAAAPAPGRAGSDAVAIIEQCKVLCGATFTPVCGGAVRGTYLNSCWAMCVGATPFVAGECAATADRFQRSSGLDTQCEARCAREPDAAFAPVCGINGFTFSSVCMARCSGVNATAAGNCCAFVRTMMPALRLRWLCSLTAHSLHALTVRACPSVHRGASHHAHCAAVVAARQQDARLMAILRTASVAAVNTGGIAAHAAQQLRYFLRTRVTPRHAYYRHAQRLSNRLLHSSLKKRCAQRPTLAHVTLRSL